MFPNYPPDQNPRAYNPNYGVPIPQNPNGYGYPPQNQYPMPSPNPMMNPPPQRKTYTPAQYQQGKMVFQAPELIPHQPMPNQPHQNPNNKKIAVSQGHPFQKKNINPIPGAPPQPSPKNIRPNNYVQPNAQPNNNQKKNPVQPQNQKNTQNQNQNYKKTATLMTVNTLANLPYSEYGEAEYSHQPFYNICAYAYNSYNGKVRNYNEDTTKTVVNYQKKIIVNNKVISPCISYFGVFDGHGGKACSAFLRDKLDEFLFNSKYFPGYPIQAIKEAFIIAEQEFMNEAIDRKRNALVDKSGSCALVALIINDILYAINLGDCRALFSTNSGEYLYQITRDHKPNDSIERRRIESSGAKVYYANKVNIEGKEVQLKESDYGEGFKFPYRISPGGISVSIYIYNYIGCKNHWRLLCKISSIWWGKRSFKC
jgi:hypothetical protein